MTIFLISFTCRNCKICNDFDADSYEGSGDDEDDDDNDDDGDDDEDSYQCVCCWMIVKL